jgi:hypothetical protein
MALPFLVAAAVGELVRRGRVVATTRTICCWLLNEAIEYLSIVSRRYLILSSYTL